MDRPDSLVGRAVAGAYICKGWELRVTARCLDEDLNADEATNFESIQGLEIIKAFVKDRATETIASKQIRPLSSGQEVWRLGYGHDHRGATFYDEDEGVIWLVAYGRHRSGATDDFSHIARSLTRTGGCCPSRRTLPACTGIVTNGSSRPSRSRRRWR